MGILLVSKQTKIVLISILVSCLIFNPTTNPFEITKGYQRNPQDINVNPDIWFNDEWKYRWRINFYWGFTETLVNYQAVIVLPYFFDYDLVKENGEDIRITSENNEELSYWIERWNPGGQSRIWVKIPIIETTTINSESNIFLYAGNENVISASSGEDVFIYFEDFEDQTLGMQPEDWEIAQAEYGDLIISNNSINNDYSLHYTDTSTVGNPFIYRNLGMDITGYIFEYYIMLDYPTRSGGLAYTTTNDSIQGGNTLFGHSSSFDLYYYNGLDYLEFSSSYFVDEWRKMEIYIKNGTHYGQTISNVWDDPSYLGYYLDLYGPVTSVNFLQFWQYPSDICSLYLDCIRVRKQNDALWYPESSFSDFLELFPAESNIIGYSFYLQFTVVFVFIFIINKSNNMKTRNFLRRKSFNKREKKC